MKRGPSLKTGRSKHGRGAKLGRIGRMSSKRGSFHEGHAGDVQSRFKNPRRTR